MSVQALERLKANGNKEIAYLESGDGNDGHIPRSISGIFSHVRKYGKDRCRDYLEELGGKVSFDHFHRTVKDNATLTVENNNLKRKVKALKWELEILKEDVMIKTAEDFHNVTIRQPTVHIENVGMKHNSASLQLDGSSSMDAEDINHNQEDSGKSSVKPCKKTAKRKAEGDLSTNSPNKQIKLGISESAKTDSSHEVSLDDGNISSVTAYCNRESLQVPPAPPNSRCSSLDTSQSENSETDDSLEEKTNNLDHLFNDSHQESYANHQQMEEDDSVQSEEESIEIEGQDLDLIDQEPEASEFDEKTKDTEEFNIPKTATLKLKLKRTAPPVGVMSSVISYVVENMLENTSASSGQSATKHEAISSAEFSESFLKEYTSSSDSTLDEDISTLREENFESDSDSLLTNNNSKLDSEKKVITNEPNVLDISCNSAASLECNKSKSFEEEEITLFVNPKDLFDEIDLQPVSSPGKEAQDTIGDSVANPTPAIKKKIEKSKKKKSFPVTEKQYFLQKMQEKRAKKKAAIQNDKNNEVPIIEKSNYSNPLKGFKIPKINKTPTLDPNNNK